MERYVGDTAPQWRTTVAWSARSETGSLGTEAVSPSGIRRAALIAAWPLGAAGTKYHTIRMCDSETGAISQQLQVDSEPREIVINSDGYGFIWTNDRISGLKFAATAAIADAGRKLRTSHP